MTRTSATYMFSEENITYVSLIISLLWWFFFLWLNLQRQSKRYYQHSVALNDNLDYQWLLSWRITSFEIILLSSIRIISFFIWKKSIFQKYIRTMRSFETLGARTEQFAQGGKLRGGIPSCAKTKNKKLQK